MDLKATLLPSRFDQAVHSRYKFFLEQLFIPKHMDNHKEGQKYSTLCLFNSIALIQFAWPQQRKVSWKTQFHAYVS